MKRIFPWFLVLLFTTGVMHAQDNATQQMIDKLTGSIQDLQEAQATQGKKIEALEKAVNELRDKVNTPATVSDSASTDDLKKLAAQVQEIDKKRQDDRDLILKEIEKLGKTTTGTTTIRRSSSVPKNTNDDTTVTPAGPQNGYEYIVKDGDLLSSIAKAFRDKGVKVSTTQILKANPGLDPTKLYIGKKIFIPDPSAK